MRHYSLAVFLFDFFVDCWNVYVFCSKGIMLFCILFSIQMCLASFAFSSSTCLTELIYIVLLHKTDRQPKLKKAVREWKYTQYFGETVLLFVLLLCCCWNVVRLDLLNFVQLNFCLDTLLTPDKKLTWLYKNFIHKSQVMCQVGPHWLIWD